jgi:hypothetical protein
MSNQKETIERLCALVTKVGVRHFHHKECHDCFCQKSTYIPVVSGLILDFIEKAVLHSLDINESANAQTGHKTDC